MPAIISALIALLVCTFAFWKGERPERLTAAAVLLGWFSTPLVQDAQVMDPEWGMFWIDVALLIFLCVMVALYRRLWLACAIACELLLVASHLAMLIDRRINMNSYLAGMAVWSFALLLALLLGTLRANARRGSARREAGTPPG
jgi:hypothetical protein